MPVGFSGLSARLALFLWTLPYLLPLNSVPHPANTPTRFAVILFFSPSSYFLSVKQTSPIPPSRWPQVFPLVPFLSYPERHAVTKSLILLNLAFLKLR